MLVNLSYGVALDLGLVWFISWRVCWQASAWRAVPCGDGQCSVLALQRAFRYATFLVASMRRSGYPFFLSYSYCMFNVCEDGQCRRQITGVIFKPAATQTAPHPIPYIALYSPW